MNEMTSFKVKNNLALTPKSELPWEPKEAWIRLIIYYLLILTLLMALQHGFSELTLLFFSSASYRENSILVANIQGAIIGFIGGFIVFIVSVPSIIAGIGIVKHKQWGRILGLILAAINLLNVPIGTVLGAYTFWVLLNEESQKYFS